MATEKRLIDANVLIRNLAAMKSMYDAISLDGIIKALKDAPTVDVVEVVHGQWLFDTHACGYYLSGVVCSRCGTGSLSKRNYCPNCGAKMDGGGTDGT